jgi:hypothetical protein
MSSRFETNLMTASQDTNTYLKDQHYEQNKQDRIQVFQLFTL